MPRLDVCRRALGTGLCFAVYGLLSLLASVTVLPLLTRWPGAPEVRERRVRRFASWSFRALLGMIAVLGLGRVEVEGREWLAQADGKLIVATHPMYLDVVALLGLLPFADCVVKGAMRRSLPYHRFVTAAGYISNADCVRLVDDCVAALKRGRALLLFPEGTRSVPDEPLRFRRGAAQVAVRSGCDILPVLIRCTPPALTKDSRWYQVPTQAWRLRIRIFAPQSLTALGVRTDLPHGVAARRLTRNLEAFFNRQYAQHERTDRRTETAHHRLARS